jgi:hypothetical protein
MAKDDDKEPARDQWGYLINWSGPPLLVLMGYRGPYVESQHVPMRSIPTREAMGLPPPRQKRKYTRKTMIVAVAEPKQQMLPGITLEQIEQEFNELMSDEAR